MKKLFLSIVCLAATATSFAQKETYDLVNYTAPKGWKKEVTETTTSYTAINNKNNWCRISIVKSTNSKGDINQDFDNEWKEMVVTNYNPPGAPKMNDIAETDGWKVKTGGTKFTFNNADAMVFLTTATGFGRCASIVAITNSPEFVKDIDSILSSVNLLKPATASIQTGNIDDKNSIVGTWGNNASENTNYRIANGVMNYISRQYTFKEDGSYYFVSKAFDPLMANLILGKETGVYEINGTSITIQPKKSVLEGWSKKNNTDDWGKLVSTKNLPLEKVTYQFTKHYFSGIQVWNLVLQNSKATQRDGPHSNNKTFENGWYYGTISSINPVIALPAGQTITTEAVKKHEPTQSSNINNTALLGTWCISASDQSDYKVKNGVVSTIYRQYTFHANGTYNCNIKTFDPLLSSILLGRENGSYQVNGNSLTITPQKSVLEEWSKKNNADQWGKLLKSQNIGLEKMTYSFVKNFIPEYNEWQLILKAGSPTKRDGPFNNYEKNAWIYILSSPARPVIKLPGE